VLCRSVEIKYAGSDGFNHSVSSRGDVKLLAHVGEMILDGVGGDAQGNGDLAIRLATRDMPQNCQFANRQAGCPATVVNLAPTVVN